MKNRYNYKQPLSYTIATALLALLALQPAAAQIGPDNTFGTSGRFLYNELGTNEYFVSVLEQPDGKVVAVGETNYDPNEGSNYRIFVVRLNQNGTYDTSWGPSPGGKVYIDTPNSTDEANAAVLQPDGKILIAGYQGSFKGTVYRLNANGTLDNTFGTGGRAVIPSESVYEFKNIKLQTNGKIVVSGDAFIDSRFSYIIARFNTNGQLDNTFSDDGYHKFRTHTSNSREDNGAGYGLAIQPDGKIVSCGYNELEDGTVVRLNANGTLDPTFASGGIKYIDFTRDVYLYSVIIDCDDKIVVGGTYDYSASLVKAQIIRLLPNGNFDNSFNGSGLGWYGNDSGLGYEIALQCDCKYLIGGSNYLARVKPDGLIDQSFASNGHYSFSFNYYPSAQTLYFGKNKIYLAGYYYHQSSFSDQGGFVLRLNNDINCGSVSADEAERDIVLNLYPNPVRDILNIQIGNDTEVKDISLTDNLGRLILSNNQFFSNGSVAQCDMTQLPLGTYYAVVTTSHGRQVLPVVKM